MSAQFNPASMREATSIENIVVDPHSRDDIPRIILALQSMWMATDLRDWIVMYLRETIRENTDQNTEQPDLTYWRIFVLAVFKFDLNCDFERLTFTVNNSASIRTLLQNDTSDFGHESLYRAQTIINNVSLITHDIWTTLNQMIVDHGFKALRGAPDTRGRIRM